MFDRKSYPIVTIKLHFGERHRRLRHLNLGLVGTRYYTFSQIDDKKRHRWANYYRLLNTISGVFYNGTETDGFYSSTETSGIYIDLNWCADGVEVTLDEPSRTR
jgi:hypothetical protein